MKTKKLLGFTLIELLIVIAIIGILAVAFLPTIMGAPAKGRDAARVADLQKLQKVLINANLEGGTYPATTCVNATSFSTYLPALGGTAPKDPKTTTWVVKTKTTVAAGCDMSYAYVKDPSTSYKFGLYAKMETKEAGNVDCDDLITNEAALTNKPSGTDDSCYAILTQ